MRGSRNVEDLNELDDIRHRFKEVRLKGGKGETGYIVVFHVKQRYKDLDTKFRSSNFRFYKTPGPADDKWDMISQVGPEGYSFLERVNKKIYEQRDQNAKGEMLVVVDWIKGAGRFYFKPPAEPVINWLRLEETGELHRTG